ncbi:DUF2249 domain-containing protein [Actinomycetospora chibensis]|uniref:DUF2249 domain-containing protein n=1 Tax=Actinomycetospora chibensis TaxID=663606 RepID=A0ABV9RR89_9PSEU|nr:DUF2249 domain-containing protein [Actinomycetospora chibensis]MDD7923229.1 DUF2249 domain-containing protein [Actinomycetospora chibensis]
MATSELDVRSMRKPDKHPAIFQAFDALAVGESFVLVNNHDPRHLREEFDTEHPGSYGWDYLDRGPARWRIRISKLTAAALPRVLCDVTTAAAADDPDAAGAVWSLSMRRRDLDANFVRLRPGGGIDEHRGPDLDVLILCLAGTGRVLTETDPLELRSGTLAWLPRGSRRGFAAGPEGLSYLTVHQRRQSLVLEPPTASTP